MGNPEPWAEDGCPGTEGDPGGFSQKTSADRRHSDFIFNSSNSSKRLLSDASKLSIYNSGCLPGPEEASNLDPESLGPRVELGERPERRVPSLGILF